MNKLNSNSKLDLYNIISWIFLGIGAVGLLVFIPKLDPRNESYLLNLISLISSISSIVGLIITILQLLKISATNKIQKETFLQTLNLVTNNELIGLVSRALEQTSLIKTLFDLKNENQTRSNLSILALDLSLLLNREKIQDAQIKGKLEEHIRFCSELESKVYLNNKGTSQEDLSEFYANFSDLQRTLVMINTELKTPN